MACNGRLFLFLSWRPSQYESGEQTLSRWKNDLNRFIFFTPLDHSQYIAISFSAANDCLLRTNTKLEARAAEALSSSFSPLNNNLVQLDNVKLTPNADLMSQFRGSIGGHLASVLALVLRLGQWNDERVAMVLRNNADTGILFLVDARPQRDDCLALAPNQDIILIWNKMAILTFVDSGLFVYLFKI